MRCSGRTDTSSALTTRTRSPRVTYFGISATIILPQSEGSMKLLIVHDQFGEIRSVAVPGQKRAFGEGNWRLAASELVAEVDAPNLLEGEELPSALKTIRGEFYVATEPTRLVPKKQTHEPRKTLKK